VRMTRQFIPAEEAGSGITATGYRLHHLTRATGQAALPRARHAPGRWRRERVSQTPGGAEPRRRRAVESGRLQAIARGQEAAAPPRYAPPGDRLGVTARRRRGNWRPGPGARVNVRAAPLGVERSPEAALDIDARSRPWRRRRGLIGCVRPARPAAVPISLLQKNRLTLALPLSRMALRRMAGPSLTKRRRVTPKPEPAEPKTISIRSLSLEIARIPEISISTNFTRPPPDDGDPKSIPGHSRGALFRRRRALRGDLAGADSGSFAAVGVCSNAPPRGPSNGGQARAPRVAKYIRSPANP